MKRFIFSILCVSVFFVGVGDLVEKAGARFKSDEKALALIQQARQALGGDSALASVQSLRIVGQSTRSFKIDGTDRTQQVDTEIAMQLPDKIMRMMKIEDDGVPGSEKAMKQVDVVVVGNGDQKLPAKIDTNGGPGSTRKIVIKKDDGTVQEYTGAEADKIIAADGGPQGDSVKRIIIKRPDGTVEEYKDGEADRVMVRKLDGDKAVWNADSKAVGGEHTVMLRRSGEHDSMRQNELLRLTLSLLLTAPQGMDVSYTFGGESDVDGTSCNIVVAEFAGSSFKIYLGKSSNLPVMMTYTGMRMPNIMMFHAKAPQTGEDKKENVMFTRKVEGAPAETAEFNVKFSDYRSVGGVQLPFKWTQTVGGATDESFVVTNYEINPANIADQFQHQKEMVRTKKEQ